MKRFAILFAAVLALGLMAEDAKAQCYGGGVGGWGGSGFSLTIGNGGFYGGGFGALPPAYGWGGGYGFHRPVYARPVYAAPIAPIYARPVYGGGFYGGHRHYGGYRGCGGYGGGVSIRW